MPKSAIDATRFTPTTPHASAKHPPSPPSSNVASSSTASPLPNRTMPGPPGETPQQKVRRLREAAARARDAKVSGFDRVLVRGRVWADRAHRFTALSLIGITAVAGVITVYALGDMMIHNRRKRREYFAQQKALHDAAVYEAQNALRHGTANPEQLALIEKEEMGKRVLEAKEAEKSQASKEGILAMTKSWLFDGLKREDAVAAESIRSEVGRGDGEEGMAQRTQHEERMRMMAAGMSTAPGEENEGMSGIGRESAILRAVEGQNAGIREEMQGTMKREGEQDRNGGLLDRLGTSVQSGGEAPKQGGGWMGFLSRR